MQLYFQVTWNQKQVYKCVCVPFRFVPFDIVAKRNEMYITWCVWLSYSPLLYWAVRVWRQGDVWWISCYCWHTHTNCLALVAHTGTTQRLLSIIHRYNHQVHCESLHHVRLLCIDCPCPLPMFACKRVGAMGLSLSCCSCLLPLRHESASTVLNCCNWTTLCCLHFRFCQVYDYGERMIYCLYKGDDGMNI